MRYVINKKFPGELVLPSIPNASFRSGSVVYVDDKLASQADIQLAIRKNILISAEIEEEVAPPRMQVKNKAVKIRNTSNTIISFPGLALNPGETILISQNALGDDLFRVLIKKGFLQSVTAGSNQPIRVQDNEDYEMPEDDLEPDAFSTQEDEPKHNPMTWDFRKQKGINADESSRAAIKRAPEIRQAMIENVETEQDDFDVEIFEKPVRQVKTSAKAGKGSKKALEPVGTRRQTPTARDASNEMPMAKPSSVLDHLIETAEAMDIESDAQDAADEQFFADRRQLNERMQKNPLRKPNNTRVR